MLAHIGTTCIHVAHVVLMQCLNFMVALVDITIFAYRSMRTLSKMGIKRHLFIDQFTKIGVWSSPIVMLTGFSTGLAVGLQAYISFNRFGIHDFMGTIVALGMLRELGPVLTGLMITSRCGSAIAAEIATMRISDQIDALKTLLIDPYAYLIVPRIAACIAALPLLSILSSACGMLGGYVLCVHAFGVNAHAYHSGVQHFVGFSDLLSGLIKATVFGFVIGLISTYSGYSARNGARGVGQATTRSVAIGSILVLVANYIVSSLLFQTGLG